MEAKETIVTTKSPKEGILKREIPTDWWSNMTVSWLSEFIKISKHREIDEAEIYELPAHLNSTAAAGKLKKFKSQQKSANGLLKTLLLIIKGEVIKSFGLSLISLTASLAGPQFVRQLIIFVDPAELSSQLIINNGIALSIIICFLNLVTLVTETSINSYNRQLTLKLKNTLTTSIYEKTFRLSAEARKNYSDGKILNMAGNDTNFIALGVVGGRDLIVTPMLIVAIVFLIWRLLGLAGFISIAVIGLTLLSTVGIGKSIGSILGQMFKADDQRVTRINEALKGILFLKYRALEEVQEKAILSSRKKQISYNKKGSIISMCGALFGEAILPLLIIASIPLYVSIQGGVITPSTIFPALMYFQMLQKPLSEILTTVSRLSMGKLAAERIEKFLAAKEISAPQSNGSEYAVECKGAKFHWPNADGSTGFSIDDLTLNIKRGSKVAIIGGIGEGKTSFLSGLLGDAETVAGEVFVNGSISYSPQEPWLVAGTIKDNILFGREEEKELLDKIIRLVGLAPDIAKSGINTELGENGISLSGGQKSRISIARTLYRNSEILILDCPLAALDAKVSRTVLDGIFESSKGATVLMATHKLQYLPLFDQIMVFKNGRLEHYGSFQELVQKNETLNAMFEAALNSAECATKEDPAIESSSNESSSVKDENVPIIQKEHVHTGSITRETYLQLFQAFSSLSLFVLGFVLAIFIALSVMAPYWLKIWSADRNSPEKTSYYLNVFVIFNLSVIFCLALLNVTSYFVGYNAACYLHDKALKSVLYAKNSFFDSNPIGRIINRFSGDCGLVDIGLVNILMGTSASIATLISTFVLILFASPYLIFLLLFLLGCYSVIYRAYLPTNRYFQRINSVAKSPLDTLITSTLTGISTIRVFGENSNFIKLHRTTLDHAMACSFSAQSIDLWFSFRIQLASLLITVAISLIASQARNFSTDFAAAIGLTLTYSTSLDIALQRLFQTLGTVEMIMTACERLLYFIHNIPQEGQRILKADVQEQMQNESLVIFDNVSIAYPSNPGRNVVKNLNLSIAPGEKIGIVGRTGSGKSTILAALLRVLDDYAGNIFINGIDIKNIGLKKLRTSIFMVPQNSQLFQGTIRSNIDPMNKYSDIEIWKALDACGLKTFVTGLPEKLGSSVDSNASNVSAGQKQALCIVPAILSKPTILVFDESTSAMDSESDQNIQRLLSEEFSTTTVISIAHRLSTVVSFDRIVVLDDGEIVEIGIPKELLLDSQSLFFELADASGERESLLEIANRINV